MTDRPICCTSEHEAWPDALKEAWAALNAPQRRLLLRARWRWRSWPNPGINPPKVPRRRKELFTAHTLLYAEELAYREWSACRGADGEVTVTTHGREGGTALKATPADVYALLTQHPDGLTVSELHDRIPSIARVTLLKWLNFAQEFSHARHERRGRAQVWFAGGRPDDA